MVTQEGKTLKIADTVRLDIPPGALKEPTYISMRIVANVNVDSDRLQSFTDQSSVIVELLPNNQRFLHPVELTLPHCLHLKSIFDPHSATIFMSHHLKGAFPSLTTFSIKIYLIHFTFLCNDLMQTLILFVQVVLHNGRK